LKILIIRLSSFGDIILTTPVIAAFKKKYPDSIIDFLVLENFISAIDGNKNIDNIITFDKQKLKNYFDIKNFAKKLKKEDYDYVFDLHSKFRSKIIANTIGVKTYTYKKRKLWKTLFVKLRLIKYQVDDTIIKNYFGAFKDFDIEYTGEKLEFNFSSEDMEKVKNYINYPVISTGASKNTKKWPVEYFAQLINLIYEKYNKKIVIIGGKEDIEDTKKIEEIVNDRCINLSGTLSLKESGALLSKSIFLVCNDSGPFHICRGVGTKTYVIFGPTSPNMFEFSKNDTLIYANEKCSPCSLHGDKKCPRGHFRCMLNITPKFVFDQICRF
jgi:lipopolysaccharide heptosyltransferase II